MRKFFTLLACIATLLCLNSCNLDRQANYLFGYEATILLLDEEGKERQAEEEIVAEYLKTNYVNENHKESFFCDHYTAMEKSLAVYVREVGTVDLEFLYSFINNIDDRIQLFGILTSENSREFVAYTTWDYASKQAWEEDKVK